MDGRRMRKKVLRGTLPRYVQARRLADGEIHYRFNPPQILIDSGVVSRIELGTDLRKVRPLAKDLNDKIDEYRNKLKLTPVLQKTHSLNKLIENYYLSNDFKLLKPESQDDYRYFLKTVQNDIGHVPYQQVTTSRAKHLYEEWVDRGIQFANHVLTVVSKVYNYAIAMEYTTDNPFKGIKRKKPKQRKVVWTEEDVIQFLNTAYSDFQYRSIGLIVQMAYEWCQRVGDMRLLKWSSIHLDSQRLELEQSKRRALVHLPISDNLTEMLTQQYEDFGFQEYVAPRTVPHKGRYYPYGMEALSRSFRSCARLSGISEELRMADLRRTGTVQMVEAGVSMPQIMSVTGHANPNSVKPYMKHTYLSANEALTARKNVCYKHNTCRTGE